jgi:hypothetical protein
MPGVTDDEPYNDNARTAAHSKLQEHLLRLEHRLMRFNSPMASYPNLEAHRMYLPELQGMLGTTSVWLREEAPSTSRLAEDEYFKMCELHRDIMSLSVDYLDNKENAVILEFIMFMLENHRLELTFRTCKELLSEELKMISQVHIPSMVIWLRQELDTAKRAGSFPLIFFRLLDEKRTKTIELRKEIEAAASQYEVVSE